MEGIIFVQRPNKATHFSSHNRGQGCAVRASSRRCCVIRDCDAILRHTLHHVPVCRGSVAVPSFQSRISSGGERRVATFLSKWNRPCASDLACRVKRRRRCAERKKKIRERVAFFRKVAAESKSIRPSGGEQPEKVGFRRAGEGMTAVWPCRRKPTRNRLAFARAAPPKRRSCPLFLFSLVYEDLTRV